MVHCTVANTVRPGLNRPVLQEEERIALSTLRNIPIAAKLLLLVIVPLALSLAVTLLYTINRLQYQEIQMVTDHMNQESSIVKQQIKQTERALTLRADAMSSDPAFTDAMLNNNQTYLQSRFGILIENINLSHIQAMDKTGNILTTEHSPVFANTSIDLASLHQQAQTQDSVTSMISTSQGWLLVVVHSVIQDGDMIGTLSIGRLLDNATLYAINFQRTNPTIFLLDEQGAINAFASPDTEQVRPTIDINQTLWEQAQQGTLQIDHTTAHKDMLHIAYSPIMPTGTSEAILGIAYSTQRVANLRQEVMTNTLIVSGSVSLIAVVVILIWGYNTLVRPIQTLTSNAQSIADGNLEADIPDISRHDEIGTLAKTFRTMTHHLRETINSLESRVAERTAELQTRMSDMQAQADEKARLLDEIQQQRETIQGMSIPVLPVTPKILVVPLVGELDAHRLNMLQEQTLHTLERSSARYLVMDITGVLMVDSQIAQGLVSVVQSARLLGVRVMLVGVRPDVAQAIVGLGLDLSTIRTAATLQESLRLLMR